jgi:hypothetical protein
VAICQSGLAQSPFPPGERDDPPPAIVTRPGSQAAVLALVRGQLTSADPIDWMFRGHRAKVYTMRLEAGVPYVIDLESEGGVADPEFFDTVLRLENSVGKPLAINDDGPGRGLNSRIGFRATETSTYRLVVTSFQPGATGSFVLRVQGPGRGLPAPASPSAPDRGVSRSPTDGPGDGVPAPSQPRLPRNSPPPQDDDVIPPE